MNTLKTVFKDEYMYTVEIDYEPVWGSFDLGSEKENTEYLERFENGELQNFGVREYERCGCCGSWNEKDSLWGIHAETPAEALKAYFNH